METTTTITTTPAKRNKLNSKRISKKNMPRKQKEILLAYRGAKK